MPLSLKALTAALGTLLMVGGGLPQTPSVPEPAKAAYDVFVLAPAEVEEGISRAGAELSQLGLQSFYRRGYLPHVTLYLSRYATAALPELRRRVKTLARETRPFWLQASGCSLTPSHWLFMDVENSPQLQQASDRAVALFAPLRDPGVPEPAWLKDVPQKREAFRAYGSPNVFAFFEPHFTQLAHQANPQLSAWFAQGTCQRWHAGGEVKALGIGPVDADGQMLRGAAEIYPLSP